ncbi:hypothetical protein QFZ79_002815 [Arthrobacter sp. V4I6]|nr:hypothetical protein [Arthrobacter sp. V4I6]MDQ0854704.1 hypothetical protein [Arthrobacter sp. V4I6]
MPADALADLLVRLPNRIPTAMPALSANVNALRATGPLYGTAPGLLDA